MSWSVQSEPGTAHELQERLPDIQPGHEISKESEEQIRVAKQQAEKILFSGALGRDEDSQYIVTLSGHANEKHAGPTPERAPEYVTVTVADAQPLAD